MTSLAVQPAIKRNEPEQKEDLDNDMEYLKNTRYVAIRQDNGNSVQLLPLEQFEKVYLKTAFFIEVVGAHGNWPSAVYI